VAYKKEWKRTYSYDQTARHESADSVAAQQTMVSQAQPALLGAVIKYVLDVGFTVLQVSTRRYRISQESLNVNPIFTVTSIGTDHVQLRILHLKHKLNITELLRND